MIKLAKTFTISAFLMVIFVSGLFSASSVVENTVTLTLDQAVEYAMKNSRSLKSSQIDLEMKKRAKNNSWNVFIPDVSASGTMARSNEQSDPMALLRMIPGVPLPPFEETEEGHWKMLANLGVSLNLSLAYISSISAAYKAYEAQEISWEQTQRETIVNVRKMFYGLLLQKKTLEIQKTSLENSRQRYIQAETNYNNGGIPEIQLLQAQVAYQNKRPEVEQLERSYNQKLDMFAFIIGFPMDSNLEIEGEIEPSYVDLDGDVLIYRYGEKSLNYLNLEKNIEKLQANLNGLNLSSYAPALALSYNLNPIYKDKFSTWPSNIGNKDKWMDNGSLSITLAWNLTNMLPWSKNRQQAQDIRDNIKKLEIQKEMLSENQKMEVYKSIDTLKQCKEQIEAMSRNVSLAQRSYDMAIKAYRSGTTEYLALKDAQSQLDQAKLGLENQKFNYISALLDLENTLGIDLVNNKTEEVE